MSDFHTQHHIETYKSLITISTEAFKFLALINGGAAVALLSFAGVAVGKGAKIDVTTPILCFALGVGLCGIAQLAAYMTQLRLFRELFSTTEPPAHQRALIVAVCAFVLGLVFFLLGCLAAADVLHR